MDWRPSGETGQGDNSTVSDEEVPYPVIGMVKEKCVSKVQDGGRIEYEDCHCATPVRSSAFLLQQTTSACSPTPERQSTLQSQMRVLLNTRRTSTLSHNIAPELDQHPRQEACAFLPMTVQVQYQQTGQDTTRDDIKVLEQVAPARG
jgi:hypothetical protein